MRARELINFDGITGNYNSITDVDNVEVGHSTIISGDGNLIVGKGPVPVMPPGRIPSHYHGDQQ